VARYRIIAWKGIPSLVEARDEDGAVARMPLSQRFQDLIDSVALREGASETEAYLDGWDQGPEIERAGDAGPVAQEVAAELEAGFQDLATRRMLGPRD
jgi:Virulence factor